jgi:hypothetical protein
MKTSCLCLFMVVHSILSGDIVIPCIRRSCLQPLAQGGRLPLHLALENNADAEVIATLLREHPGAARMATKNHMVRKLHFLCMKWLVKMRE